MEMNDLELCTDGFHSDVCWCGHPSHGGWCPSGRPEPCECWVGDPRPIVAAERCRIAEAVGAMFGQFHPMAAIEDEPTRHDVVSRKAVLLAIVDPR